MTDGADVATYRMGAGADVATTAAGGITGRFSDGAGTCIAGWNVATGARLPFTD